MINPQVIILLNDGIISLIIYLLKFMYLIKNIYFNLFKTKYLIQYLYCKLQNKRLITVIT